MSIGMDAPDEMGKTAQQIGRTITIVRLMIGYRDKYDPERTNEKLAAEIVEAVMIELGLNTRGRGR